MTKRIALTTLVFLFMATTVYAGDCVLGVYGDEQGSYPFAVFIGVPEHDFFEMEVYYVIESDNFVYGVAWQRELTGIFDLLGSQAEYYDYATFLETREEGYRIGLGTCYWGNEGRTPITIMKETLLLTFSPDYPKESAEAASPYTQAWLHVVPNTLQDAEHVMVADCAGDLYPCQGGVLQILYSIPVEGPSFGRIKATFR